MASLQGQRRGRRGHRGEQPPACTFESWPAHSKTPPCHDDPDCQVACCQTLTWATALSWSTMSSEMKIRGRGGWVGGGANQRAFNFLASKSSCPCGMYPRSRKTAAIEAIPHPSTCATSLRTAGGMQGRPAGDHLPQRCEMRCGRNGQALLPPS